MTVFCFFSWNICKAYLESRLSDDNSGKSAVIRLHRMFVLSECAAHGRECVSGIKCTSPVLPMLICIASLCHGVPMLSNMFACGAHVDTRCLNTDT